jgi:putative toxin-antitoxin system antitoxin component (TIGR02293 family)
MDLSLDETAERLGLARRTLARRKTLRTLDANESERVVRLADALAHAIDVLGSREKARRWLGEPNRALGGASPMSLLDTGLGAQAVDELLVRIDHGVFS